MKNITKIGLSIISFFIFTIPAFADCTVTASPQNIAVDHTTNVTYVMTVSSYPFNYFGVNGVGTWGSQFVSAGAGYTDASDPTYFAVNGSGNYPTMTVSYSPTSAGTITLGTASGNDLCNDITLTAAVSGPAYTANTAAMTATTGLLGSLVSAVFTVIPLAISIVGGLVVTLFGIRWLIGFARKNMHG